MTSIYFRAVFFPALPILTLGVYLPIDHNNHGIDPSKFMFAHSQLLSLPTSRADSNLGLHRRRPPHCPLLHLRYQVNFTFCLSFHCIVLYLYFRSSFTSLLYVQHLQFLRCLQVLMFFFSAQCVTIASFPNQFPRSAE